MSPVDTKQSHNVHKHTHTKIKRYQQQNNQTGVHLRETLKSPDCYKVRERLGGPRDRALVTLARRLTGLSSCVKSPGRAESALRRALKPRVPLRFQANADSTMPGNFYALKRKHLRAPREYVATEGRLVLLTCYLRGGCHAVAAR